MRKSYRPIERQNSRILPPWVGPGTPKGTLTTDDAQYAICYLRSLNSDASQVQRICYRDSRGRWKEEDILRSRIKEVAVLA